MTSVTKYLNKNITNVIIAGLEIEKRNEGGGERMTRRKCQVRACTSISFLFFFFNCDFFSLSPFDLLGRIGFSSALAIAIVLVLNFPIFYCLVCRRKKSLVAVLL